MLNPIIKHGPQNLCGSQSNGVFSWLSRQEALDYRPQDQSQ